MWEATPVAAERSSPGTVRRLPESPPTFFHVYPLCVELRVSPTVLSGTAIAEEQHIVATIIASRNRFRGLRSIATRSLSWLVCLCASIAFGQQPTVHYFQRADMAPGAIGAAQLMRGGPLPGYFQPVVISAPRGTEIALAIDGVFDAPRAAPINVGLLVGRVYRLKVANIPNHEGHEVFPSIEIINRLYPPRGQETRFPVPIELTREELELAMRGQFITRVVYLEDPHGALPHREDPQHQRYFDVGPRQDPLRVADELGRPMAILRIGSRVPQADTTTGRFLFESPPWMRLPSPAAVNVQPARQARNATPPPSANRSMNIRASTTATGPIRRDDR